MTAWLLSLLGGNGAGLAAMGAAIVTFIGWMTLKLRRARKDGINETKVDHYEQSIKDVERAAQAGARVGTASGERLQPDKYDRDRR
jgi:hypothetical protein